MSYLKWKNSQRQLLLLVSMQILRVEFGQDYSKNVAVEQRKLWASGRSVSLESVTEKEAIQTYKMQLTTRCYIE